MTFLQLEKSILKDDAMLKNKKQNISKDNKVLLSFFFLTTELFQSPLCILIAIIPIG